MPAGLQSGLSSRPVPVAVGGSTRIWSTSSFSQTIFGFCAFICAMVTPFFLAIVSPVSPLTTTYALHPDVAGAAALPDPAAAAEDDGGVGAAAAELEEPTGGAAAADPEAPAAGAAPAAGQERAGVTPVAGSVLYPLGMRTLSPIVILSQAMFGLEVLTTENSRPNILAMSYPVSFPWMVYIRQSALEPEDPDAAAAAAAVSPVPSARTALARRRERGRRRLGISIVVAWGVWLGVEEKLRG